MIFVNKDLFSLLFTVLTIASKIVSDPVIDCPRGDGRNNCEILLRMGLVIIV